MTIRYTSLDWAINAVFLAVLGAIEAFHYRGPAGDVFAAVLWILACLNLCAAVRLHLAGRVVTGRIRLPWQPKARA